MVRIEESPTLISIIILNWNGKKDTIECISSLQDLKHPNFSIIVADNGSTDDSVDSIKNVYPDIFILENGENLGFAEGNNRAITYAFNNGAEAVVILNNDTIVDPGLLSSFCTSFDNLPNPGILGTVSFYYDKPDVIWAAGGEWDATRLELKHICCNEREEDLPSKEPYSVNYAIGCALFVHRSVVEKIGLMDPQFFLNFEENDWCQRAIKSGLINYTVPNAKIWHKVSSSFGGESPLWKYYMTRNLLLWSKRHLPPAEYRAVIKKTIREFLPHKTPINTDKKLSLKYHYWALFDYLKQFKKRFESPFYLAQFFGIVHYFFRRFGPCPESTQQRLRK